MININLLYNNMPFIVSLHINIFLKDNNINILNIGGVV